MSKINSFVLIIIIAISLASCSDKSKTIINTWRLEDAKFSKPNPPQVQAIINSKIEYMKGYFHTTYKEDGTVEDVQESHVSKGTWDITRNNKTLYSTDERGMTVKYTIVELTKDKLTISVANGPGETLTYYYVPFSAKDTLNRKPAPQQMMQPRTHAGPPQQEGAPQQEGKGQQQVAPAQSAQPTTPKQK